ncbi:MAG: hypothetical protein HQL21_09495 [Candidatus Omnitrophica bacterium]|nr:hypothetical protein [Candidatus Omnitrophota bacterium]
MVSSKMSAAYQLLRGTASAAYAYDLIDQLNVPLFALTEASAEVQAEYPAQAGAVFYHTTWSDGTISDAMIVVDDRRGYSDQAMAALIAHEATHADYAYNTLAWTELTLLRYPDVTPPLSPNSINQEYDCFCNQMKTWEELRGGLTDRNNDAWYSYYEQGESVLKDAIREAYTAAGQLLPDF